MLLKAHTDLMGRLAKELRETSEKSRERTDLPTAAAREIEQLAKGSATSPALEKNA